MSTRNPSMPDRKPMIALVHNADRVFQAHMVASAHERGRPDIKPSHNAVFAHLGDTPRRAADLALAAGITRQSMGELVRELVDLRILEMVPDPTDGRAKLVTFSTEGKKLASTGLRHLRAVEKRLEAEFGEDYETARRVLQRLPEILDDIPGTAQG